MAAVEGLRRRHTVGGSWYAELSLARTARWLDGLGRSPTGSTPDTGSTPEPPYPTDLTSTMDSPLGLLRYVRPPGALAGYTPEWTSPPHRPGADPPTWRPA
jgi:hypothetical protein